MPALYSTEEVQKLLQGILKSLPLEHSSKRCSNSTTPGRCCELCMQLDAVDLKLCAHFEGINKLLKIKAEAKEFFNQHHDPLARLPVEIALHIFSIYTESGRPLLLGAVSKSWRKIAFNTPHLWNTVDIHIFKFSTDDLLMKAELTKEWLDRSRQLPLHLLFSLSFSKRNFIGPKSLIPLFTVLQNVSPRRCSLYLNIPSSFYTTFLGEVTCAPTLETLKLFDYSDERGYFRLPHTPLLKHLGTSISIPFITIKWSCLTTVEVGYITMGEFFNLLRLSAGLASFRLDSIVGNPAELTAPSTPLTHSSLRELYLCETMNPSNLMAVLNLTTFPSLKKFRHNSGFGDSFPNTAITSMFNRSCCRLTHLDLRGDLRNGTSDDLISLLSDLPAITHFKLQDEFRRHPDIGVLSDKLLRRLTPSHPNEVTSHFDRLLPRLESLKFLGYKKFSWSCLASLVSATISDGSNPCLIPERRERTNSIGRISFKVFAEKGMERIDTQSLAYFKAAHQAGIFCCQVLREGYCKDQVIDPLFGGDDLP